MLTIQPNFSQHRIQARPSFGSDDDAATYTDNPYGYSDDLLTDGFVREEGNDVADFDDDYNQKKSDLIDVRDGINATMENIKELEKEVQLPDWLKGGIGIMFTLGAAAVTGISTKFGFSKTSEYLGDLSRKPAIKKASGNIKESMGKLGKAVGRCIDTVKDSKIYKSIAGKVNKFTERFGKTSLGKKVKAFSDRMAKNPIVVKIKNFFAGAKKVDGAKIVDRTGDVLGTATGVSTAAVGVVNPEQKTKVEG